LIGEELIKSRDIGSSIGLTHRGIRKVEDARRYPDRHNEYFSPNTINNVINKYGTMNNPAIEQGTSNSNQTITITTQQQHESIIEAIKVIKEIVQQEGESIPDKKHEELEQEIADAELESK
jgi:hypothetical protein